MYSTVTVRYVLLTQFQIMIVLRVVFFTCFIFEYFSKNTKRTPPNAKREEERPLRVPFELSFLSRKGISSVMRDASCSLSCVDRCFVGGWLAMALVVGRSTLKLFEFHSCRAQKYKCATFISLPCITDTNIKFETISFRM